jgi:hypothetical protein
MHINIAKVESVYSGKAGRCACGCSGIHRSASTSKSPTSQVNDRQVRRVCEVLSKAPGTKRHGKVLSATVDGRLYVAYTR